MKRLLVLAFVLLLVPAALAHAGDKITYESAKAIARAKAPNGLLTSHQLVREHDRSLYSFWFNEPGKSGVKLVQVDAASGKVIKVKHQSIEAAQKERAKESRASASRS